MTDIAIIIPVHEYNENIEQMLKRAISSVPTGFDVRISCKNGLSEQFSNLKEINNVNITIYENKESEDSSFQTLVNQAVGDSKWFSILEFDDEYTYNWLNNVSEYINFKPDVNAFFVLEDLFDFNTNEYIGVKNEAAWASSFSNEIGYIDYDCLESYYDFYPTGCVFNTEDWLEVGGLKNDIDLTFWYEFMLRFTNNDKKIYVIPKVCYNHYVIRENSLHDIYVKTMDSEKAEHWFNVAKEQHIIK